MNPQLGDVSEDGFWVLTTEGWQPSEKQLMALNQGAIPHNASLPQQTVIANYSVEGKRTQSSEAMKYIFSGAIALALILLLIGMYHDSWTVDQGYDSSEDPEWLENAHAGMGLTEVTMDCSEVSGIDDETGEENKDMCKFAAGLLTGKITWQQVMTAPSVKELTDDLPSQMSGDIDDGCKVMKDIDDDDYDDCSDRSTAGTTAIVFFWFSFIGALVTGIIVIISLYQTIPYVDDVEKYGILGSAIFALLGFLSWLILKPWGGEISFGPAFYITIFSIVLLTALAVIQFIRPKAIGNLVLFE
jgi:hypothetical protein